MTRSKRTITASSASSAISDFLSHLYHPIILTCVTPRLQPLFRELSISQESQVNYYQQNYTKAHLSTNCAKCLQVRRRLQVHYMTVN